MLERIQNAPLHPFLFAAYPVLALLGHNIEEIKFSMGLRALAVSLLAAGVVFILLRMLFKDGRRAALVASLAMITFFAYGHIYSFLEKSQALGFLGRHRLLAPLWLGIFILLAWLLTRRRVDTQAATRLLNLVGAVLLVFPVLQMGFYGARTLQAETQLPEAPAGAAALRLPEGETPPDIYYIILDAYSRADVLQEEFGLDNSAFLEQLRQMGFFVGDCSRSNYAQTQLSLASSLNMDYVQNLGEQFQPGNTSRAGVKEKIRRNLVRGALEGLGYRTVAFETGYKVTQWEDAAVYLSPAEEAYGGTQVWSGLNDFEAMLLQTTAAKALLDGVAALPKSFQAELDNTRQIHRERLLYALEKLESMPQEPGPKFVFAHLVIPHPPYVFGPNGEFKPLDGNHRAAYRDQVLYLNQRILKIVESLIKNSSTPPVIILQGDHGAIEISVNKRMDILNAYYLPGQGSAQLYESISPVNTFRRVFDAYFGGQYPRLEDQAYFSFYKTPYEFNVIPEMNPACQGKPID